MELRELEYGMILEVRNGNKYLVHAFSVYDMAYNLCGEGVINLEREYNKGMEHEEKNDLDIVKVYEDYTCQNVIWERKEINLSSDEKAILKCLPKEIKWIARDKEGELWCFENKPFKASTEYDDYWDYKDASSECYELNVFKHLFQFVKWEDEEPTSIEKLLEAGD